MKEVPKWVSDIIETTNLLCAKCQNPFNVNNLISIGIQESSLVPHDDVLCFGMSCKKCNEIIIFEIKEMNLIEFAFGVIEKETDPKENTLRAPDRKKSFVARKSKITQKEVNDHVKFLNNIKTHEDLLVAMGISPEDINKYNYKRKKPE